MHGVDVAAGSNTRPGRSRPPAPGTEEGGKLAAPPVGGYRAGVQ
jgi:hypothetical protein